MYFEMYNQNFQHMVLIIFLWKWIYQSLKEKLNKNEFIDWLNTVDKLFDFHIYVPDKTRSNKQDLPQVSLFAYRDTWMYHQEYISIIFWVIVKVNISRTRWSYIPTSLSPNQ